MIDNKYHLQSRLAWYIENFVAQKRKEGFIYRSQLPMLLDLDLYLYDYDLDLTDLTAPNLKEWRNKRVTEGASFCQGRNAVLNELLKYLQSIGISVYIPQSTHKVVKPVPYLMSNAEIAAFFEVADQALLKGPPKRAFSRMLVEYRVIFRLILSCGLRNNEACSLKIEDINFMDNSALIRCSKGDKDRLVYFDSKMAQLLKNYIDWIIGEIDTKVIWLFPGSDPNKHMGKSHLDKKFSQYWNQTPFAGKTAKHPTIHSFRHKFVITKMTQWIENNEDVDVMMPYLSKYLGHSDRTETYYYYHQVEESMNLIRKIDKRCLNVIPEVENEEE